MPKQKIAFVVRTLSVKPWINYSTVQNLMFKEDIRIKQNA